MARVFFGTSGSDANDTAVKLVRYYNNLRGLPAIRGDSAHWLPPADLPNVERDGEEGILFLDELNAAPASMQAACFGLVLDRKVGDYKLPDGWRIVAAGNKQSDRAAANKMPSALANRFAHIDVDVDPDSFSQYATERDADPIMTAFLRFRPALVHNMEGELRAFPTPRAWMQVNKVVGAPETLRPRLVAGLVGEATGAEFEGFVRVYRSLPSLEGCITDPSGSPLPKEPAARFAIASGLARRAKAENFANIIEYMSRLPLEFTVMCVVDAIRRDTSLQHTPPFVKFANENQEAFL
jgi:hypothetical protein